VTTATPSTRRSIIRRTESAMRAGSCTVEVVRIS
jgi:hypothetical protein